PDSHRGLTGLSRLGGTISAGTHLWHRVGLPCPAALCEDGRRGILLEGQRSGGGRPPPPPPPPRRRRRRAPPAAAPGAAGSGAGAPAGVSPPARAASSPPATSRAPRRPLPGPFWRALSAVASFGAYRRVRVGGHVSPGRAAARLRRRPSAAEDYGPRL